MPDLHFMTFACEDHDQLADFWAAALGGERRGLPASLGSSVVELPGDGPDLLFKPDIERGTEQDLPIHLDVEADDREAAVADLEDLGATIRETKSETFETHTSTWTVMEDPEGNGVCLTEY
jgi:hypothetical protein